MSRHRRVEPLTEPFDRTVTIPGSKSLTNRALVCAALADGTSNLTGALFADDTEAMIEGLRRLGAGIMSDRAEARIEVEGTKGVLAAGPIELNARLSGTTARFLLPVLAIGEGPYRLDGLPPLRARPMADGIRLLRDLGARVTADDGHLPVTIEGGVSNRRPARIPGRASSQFLSGVLLAAPAWLGGREVSAEGALVSRPYVDMTIAVMRSFGAEIVEEPPTGWNVRPTGYHGSDYAIEPDASAASYFFAAAAITGGRVRIDGLGSQSLQGDLAFVRVLERMGARVTIDQDATTVEGTGVLHGVEADLRDFSDTAPTLAVTAIFADSPTRITGIGFIRGKETDRIGAVVRELARLGIRGEEQPDGLVVNPGSVGPGVVETYDDHRMAMSFALAGLVAPGIEIADPECVAKTFPDFFDVLETLHDRPPGRA
jgi:3-phosphoshikimate 1-carboxyvinyltransferase